MSTYCRLKFASKLVKVVKCMRAIVTGAAGFIGSKFMQKLMDEGYSVIGIDRMSQYYAVELKELRTNYLLTEPYQILNMDLAEPNRFDQIVSDFRPSLILHLAAQPGIRLPEMQNFQYIQDNIQSFSNVLNAAIKYQVSDFVYASSSSVYGDSDNSELKETDKNLQPKSFYGLSKLMNEKMAVLSSMNSDTHIRGLRFFTVYGPWGRPDMAYFRLIANALEGVPFKLFGNGSISRDFTFIDDVVSIGFELIKQLSVCEPGHNDVVNIGGGKPYSLNEMIDSIAKNTGRELNFPPGESHLGDVTNTRASTELQFKLIGANPTTSLDIGIKKTIEWMRHENIRRRAAFWINSVE